MAKFAIIKTGGKQYLVTPGLKLKIEKIAIPSEKEGNKIVFDEVLALGNEESLNAGNPKVAGASVQAEWQKEGKGKKVIIQKFHSKNRYRKRQGHRQQFTEVLIKEIVVK